MQAGSWQPFKSPWAQVHREVDVPAKRPEAGGMETPYGGDVAGNRPDGQVLVAASAGFLDHTVDEHAADALIPRCLGDDDRLDLSTHAPVEQAGQADDLAARRGYPGSRPSRLGEVIIESRSRIVSADRRVAVDTPVVFRQLRPQGPASVVVTVGVVANNNVLSHLFAHRSTRAAGLRARCVARTPRSCAPGPTVVTRDGGVASRRASRAAPPLHPG